MCACTRITSARCSHSFLRPSAPVRRQRKHRWVVADHFLDRSSQRVTIGRGRTPCIRLDIERAEGPGEPGGAHTIQEQLRAQLRDEALRLRGDKWWDVKYERSPGVDAGGLFRDSLSRLAAELCSGRSDLFVPIETRGGGGGGGGGATETWAPNPLCAAAERYRFVGRVMAACARSSRPTSGGSRETLAVNLPGLVWRRLADLPVAWADFAAMDPAQAALYDQVMARPPSRAATPRHALDRPGAPRPLGEAARAGGAGAVGGGGGGGGGLGGRVGGWVGGRRGCAPRRGSGSGSGPKLARKRTNHSAMNAFDLWSHCRSSGTGSGPGRRSWGRQTSRGWV
jgi:hypothetical protein